MTGFFLLFSKSIIKREVKMIEIRSLEDTSFEGLFEGFNLAFADYEMQLNKNELQTMLFRRGFVPELSFGAFIEDSLVAFTFNGIGSFEGVKTAYDTGTGTIKEFRGKGLATRIFNYSIPFLKDAGVSQYLLEVLQHNTKAVSVYRKLGFEVSREFYYSVQKNENIRLNAKKMDPDIIIEETDFTLKDSMRRFWEFNPSWQNSFESISRKPNDFKILGAFRNSQLLGYCIFEPTSGDITQIAIDAKYRRIGLGTSLIKSALKYNMHHSLKAINTEINCDSMSEFLNSISMFPSGKQYEMIKEL